MYYTLYAFLSIIIIIIIIVVFQLIISNHEAGADWLSLRTRMRW